ncbi:MAG TPA: TadE/TadG family type IV pilus assembly protein [Candidatus Limnocylindria bacterium]|nr:TadE/TadG family type IV pilus assembly protein [Candidatus Limnocylindria bacterium]
MPPRFARDEGAQSLVETALSLSVLVFLILGGVDLGRAYVAQVGVLNAARAGAFAGASQAATTDPAIASYATEELGRTIGVDPALATITVTHTTGGGGERLLTVRVEYPFRTVVPWPLLPNALALDRSAIFREYP